MPARANVENGKPDPVNKRKIQFFIHGTALIPGPVKNKQHVLFLSIYCINVLAIWGFPSLQWGNKSILMLISPKAWCLQKANSCCSPPYSLSLKPVNIEIVGVVVFPHSLHIRPQKGRNLLCRENLIKWVPPDQ